MDLSSIHRGVCCFNVPFPQRTPASHSSLILGVFCGMTNEGFWEDFLLPTLNNSDGRQKESSLVIFLSHGPRRVHLVMSHRDKAPLSAGEKVSQVTDSANLVEVFKRQPETRKMLPASSSFSSSWHYFFMSILLVSFLYTCPVLL